MTYTYDPTKINDKAVDQMRFELGDTEVSGGKDTCALCDEEYRAMILKAKADGKGWKWAQYLCLKAIRMRFSMEVNSTIDGMSLQLAERYKIWDEMYLRMMKTFQIPVANEASLGSGHIDEGHYFRLGQGDNPRTLMPSTPFKGFPYP